MTKSIVKNTFADYANANAKAESEFRKIISQRKKPNVSIMPFSEPLKSFRYAEMLRNIFYNAFCAYYGNKENQDYLRYNGIRNKLSDYMLQATQVLEDKGLYYIFAHNSYKDIQENIMLPQGEYSELIELLSHIVSDVATSYDREFTDVLDDLAKA